MTPDPSDLLADQLTPNPIRTVTGRVGGQWHGTFISGDEWDAERAVIDAAVALVDGGSSGGDDRFDDLSSAVRWLHEAREADYG